MASDTVKDLDLDQPHDCIDGAETTTNPEGMHGIRAYLAAQYLCSVFAATWHKTHHLPFQSWTATCCDILAGNVDDDAQAAKTDQTLAWLIRLQHFVAEAAQLDKRGGREQHEEQHLLYMVKGMEAQLREFQSQMSREVSSQRKYKTGLCTQHDA